MHTTIVVLLSVTGEVERAIKDYNSAIQLNPDLPKPIAIVGTLIVIKAIIGHDRAIEDYSKAITLNPNFAEAYTILNTYNNNGEIMPLKITTITLKRIMFYLLQTWNCLFNRTLKTFTILL